MPWDYKYTEMLIICGYKRSLWMQLNVSKPKNTWSKKECWAMPVSSWCLKIHFSLKQQKVQNRDKMSMDTNAKSILIQFALVRASTAVLKQWLLPVLFVQWIKLKKRCQEKCTKLVKISWILYSPVSPSVIIIT